MNAKTKGTIHRSPDRAQDRSLVAPQAPVAPRASDGAMTLGELRRAVEALPVGTLLTLPREALLKALINSTTVETIDATTAPTWRERLWTCPAETRLGVPEIADALGRPPSWVYRAVSAARGSERLPARRLDGELVVEADALREWVRRRELP